MYPIMLHYRTNLAPNLRPIASYVSEIQGSLYAIVATIELKNFRSSCVAIDARACGLNILHVHAGLLIFGRAS